MNNKNCHFFGKMGNFWPRGTANRTLLEPEFPFPRKRSTKTPRKIRGKFGAKFGRKLWDNRGCPEAGGEDRYAIYARTRGWVGDQAWESDNPGPWFPGLFVWTIGEFSNRDALISFPRATQKFVHFVPARALQ